ncbi:MAG: TetR/AcrR family transcriptional regulator [Deltaproteobacteria bacterium]|nr:TetR/AcrR family transcriptional regulator [Deltaproteobacteria bacterium]
MPSRTMLIRKPRWHRRPTERPEEISAAALRVFTRRGLHQTTLDDVAKEAGISKGTIYLYFKNKEDLFIATAQQVVPALDEIVSNLSIPSRTKETLADTLRSIARTMYRRFRTPAYLAFFGLIAAETLRHPEWGQLYFERIVLAVNQRIAALLQDAMAAGTIRKLDPILTGRAFAGMFLIMAVTQEHLGGKRFTSFSEKQIVDSLTDIFLHGIRSKRERHA